MIRLRTSGELEVQVRVNGRLLGDPRTLEAGKSCTELRIPLTGNAAWKDAIKSLQVDFKGAQSTFVEIDSILVDRGAGQARADQQSGNGL